MIDKIILGHCLEKMLDMPAGIFQTCITSPPYWRLRDYGLEPIVWDGDPDCDHEWITNSQEIAFQNNLGNNDSFDRSGVVRGVSTVTAGFCVHCGAWLGSLGLEPTPELYIGHLVQIFSEVKRVLRDDGTLWLNIGDSYAANTTGSAGNCSTLEGGKTTQNIAMNRPNKSGNGLKPKDMVLIPFRLALALQADGWWIRSTIIWEKPSCLPSSVKDRPTTSHEYVFLLAKSKKYYYDYEAIMEPNANPERTNYAPGKRAYVEGNTEQCNDKRTRRNDGFEAYAKGKVCKGRNKRTVWTVNPKPYKEAHFATFPPKLIEPMILAGSAEKACEHCGAAWIRVIDKKPTGRGNTESILEDGIRKRSSGKSLAQKRQAYRAMGLEGPPKAKTIGFRPSCECPESEGTGTSIVFDPFAGSGTTLAGAKRHGRHYCGIEASPEYITMAEKRIRNEVTQLNLDF